MAKNSGVSQLFVFLFSIYLTTVEGVKNEPQSCEKFGSKYNDGPLLGETVRTCDRGLKLIFPDVMYKFRGKVHYATRNDREFYDIYNFLDGNMTALDSEPLETTKQAWNFCTRNNDTLTFVTSYDDQHLFAFFERPGSGVMIKIGFNPDPEWVVVANSSVYKDCTDKATPTFSMESFSAMRQVFSVNEPEVVFLLKNDEMVRCEWRNGLLIYVNSTKSPFGSCPRGDLHFIDGHGNYFQLFKSQNQRDSGYTDDVVRSKVEAIDEKPALAYPLLGYEILDSKSLVKVRSNQSCAVDGKKSRLYQVYDGKQLQRILRRIERSQKSAWLRIQEINARKSSFCDEVEKKSCCVDVVERVKLAHIEAKSIDVSNDEIFLLYCEVEFTTGYSSCPNVKCFQTDHEIRSRGGNFICEIPLADDPPCFIRLDEILGSMEEDISYRDAMEALSLMDTIAATMEYQDKNDVKFLSKLFNSFQALEVVDYSSLSPSRAQNLVLDVVNVMDNIVDDETADVWISIQGSRDENNGSIIALPGSGKDHTRPTAIQSPSEVLFTMESVLESIVSGQVSSNSSYISDFSLNFKTENVISDIRVVGHQEESIDLNGSFVSFKTSDAQAPSSRVTIVSQYPKLMQLIAKVGEGKPDSSSSTCQEEDDCSISEKRNIEYVAHSPVISASVMEKGRKVSSGVTFAIQFSEDDIPNPHSRYSKFYFSCRYLASEANGVRWDDKGCKVSDVDHDQKLVYCTCNHTTNFAILLQVVPPKIKKEDLVNLQIISYVGESISVLCLIFTLATFIVFRHSLKSARMVAHFHLVVALIIFHVTQLLTTFAEKEKDNKAGPCVAVAALTHFSLLASFCWMLVEGILLYISVINVFHSMNSMNVMRYILGWAVPGVIAGITAIYGLQRPPYPTCYLQGVGDESCPWQQEQAKLDASPNVQIIEWCWLSASSYLIWAMVVPAAIIVLTNTIVLIRVSVVIAKTAKATNMYRPTTERKKDEHVRKCLKGAFVLMPILGVPWILGLIPQAGTHVGMLYAFTLLNSIQGIFILVFYCVLSSEVRSAFNRCLQKKHFLHSQNYTSNTSGRHSYGDQRSDSRKTRKKSRQTSTSDISKANRQSSTAGNSPTSPLSQDEKSNGREEILFDRTMNNDFNNGKLLSATTAT